MHDLTVLIMLAGALAIAFALGWLTDRLGLSTLVGYLLAGIAVGPYTPGFVANPWLAAQMSEIGVVLLMFGVGLHFHPADLLRVWRIALPGAFAQSAVATVIGWAGARWLGWSHAAGIVFGMALAVASTVVLVRMLAEQGRLGSRDGHVAVGWLIVEDFFTIGALVVLPALVLGVGGIETTGLALGAALVKAAAFGAVVWIAGTRLLAPVMEQVAKRRSAELFTLAIFVVALGIAVLAAGLFNVSVALGAFFAGLVVGHSRFGPQAAADMAPFRDVFAALFFVSVGMLVNPAFVVENPWPVLLALGIILVAKPLVALFIVLGLRDTPRTAGTVAVGLAQIGEFSFILGSLGTALGVLPKEGMDALVTAAMISIAINPLLFKLSRRIENRTRSVRAEREAGFEPSLVPGGAASPLRSGEALRPLVLIAGSGALARELAKRCLQSGVPPCVIDKDLESLDRLREEGIHTVFGDPGRVDVLAAASVREAPVMVLAHGTIAEKIQACVAARQQNPRILIVALASGRAEHAWLQEVGASAVIDANEDLAASLMRLVLDNL
jgi:monovalent cation:H+ antiporter-2, CPA2 family